MKFRNAINRKENRQTICKHFTAINCRKINEFNSSAENSSGHKNGLNTSPSPSASRCSRIDSTFFSTAQLTLNFRLLFLVEDFFFASFVRSLASGNLSRRLPQKSNWNIIESILFMVEARTQWSSVDICTHKRSRFMCYNFPKIKTEKRNRKKKKAKYVAVRCVFTVSCA